MEEFTIEHIMPQNENLSAKWREELGSDWQRVHKELLHTLGNLTLTRYNSATVTDLSRKNAILKTALNIARSI